MAEKLDKNLQKNKDFLTKSFENSADFYMKDIEICGCKACICALEGLTSLEKLWIMMLDGTRNISDMTKKPEELFSYIWNKTSIPVDKTILEDKEGLITFLTAGASVILFDGLDKGFVISTQNQPLRSVGEPSGEGNLRGSREGFTEALRLNISMVRRLIRTEKLIIENFRIGEMTKTEVALLYHKDAVPQVLLDNIKSKLQDIKMQMVFDAGYLEPFLSRHPGSLFTATSYTERPTKAAAKICEGKIVIIVNGTPFALILPTFFSENFASLDDYAQRPYFASFIRILKYTTFLIATMLPGIFVGIAGFTPELFPPELLYKVAVSEQSTPMPLLLEALFVIFLLEVIREAGLRLPKPIGHSVSLVAALIIGDASVKAGLLGTPIVVVAAITSIATFAVPSLYEPVIVLRVLFLLAGGVFGPIGLVLMGLIVIINICSVDTFGVPYTAPIMPFSVAIFKDGIFRASWKTLAKDRFTIKDLSGAHFEKVDSDEE